MNLLLKYLKSNAISLKEFSFFLLVTAVVLGLGYEVWGPFLTLYLWLLVLSCWAFLHVKKSKKTQQRFRDIDARDIDYKEYIDKKFLELNLKLEHFSSIEDK